MKRIPSSKSTLVYRVATFDVAAAIAAPILAFWILDPAALSPVPVQTESLTSYVIVSVISSVCFFVLFHVSGGLSRYFSLHDAIESAKASACAVTATAAFDLNLLYLDRPPRPLLYSLHFLVLLAILIGGRLLYRAQANHRDSHPFIDIAHDDERSIIVVGAGRLAWLYIQLLQSIPVRNQHIAAILDDDKGSHGRSISGHVIIGGTQEAAVLLDDFAQHGIEISGFVICERDRHRTSQYRERLASLCRSRGLRLEVLAEEFSLFASATRGREAQDAAPSLMLPSVGYLRTKRAIDAALATFAVVLFLPLFAFTGLLILVSIGSPVVFWQRRVGRHGHTIFISKFKTMRNPIDRSGRILSMEERCSRLGKFLRATRLDELPQLFNVIRGDMALVGPRPLLPVDQPEGSTLRLAMAPGLTGWAQIHGGKLVSVEEKNALDEWYVHNASLRLDAQIIWRTFSIVLTGDQRNEERLATALRWAIEDKKQWGTRQPTPEGQKAHRSLIDGPAAPARLQ